MKSAKTIRPASACVQEYNPVISKQLIKSIITLFRRFINNPTINLDEPNKKDKTKMVNKLFTSCRV